jgi:Phosphotransferase enzyme family
MTIPHQRRSAPNTTDIPGLLRCLLADVGLPAAFAREPLRIWPHSRVERLRFPGRASVVFKYADAPFDREHLVLRLAARCGLPVPHVQAARTEQGVLAMLMDDLGEPAREADDYDGAGAAARLHEAAGAVWLSRITASGLATLPHRTGVRLRRLGLPGVASLVRALDGAAASRADGAELPPFGLCHAGYHPTALHIGEGGWHLLDFSRAFTGPGLLDLASWHGTLAAPVPARTLGMIESYVAVGGPRQALAARGGLDAASWALGWHRVLVADWFAQQIERGWADGADDMWTSAIIRHLTAAATLLKV